MSLKLKNAPCQLLLLPLLVMLLAPEGTTFKVASTLRLSQLDIPPTTVVGDTIEMSCLYELDNDSLYAVKWYKNGREFFRFVPQDSPVSAQYLKMDGVKVDLENSNHQTVILKDISLKSTGNYRCEVSTDAPSFVTLSIEKFMFVYALPKEGPAISGHKRFYRYGDTININCSTAESKPSAVINWIINDKIQVDTNNRQLVSGATMMTARDTDTDTVQHTFSRGLRTSERVFSANSAHLNQRQPALLLARSPIVDSSKVEFAHSREQQRQTGNPNTVNANNTDSNQLNLVNNHLSTSSSNANSSHRYNTNSATNQSSLNLEYTIANLQLTVDQHLIDYLLSAGYKAQTGIVLQQLSQVPLGSASSGLALQDNDHRDENYYFVSDRNKVSSGDSQVAMSAASSVPKTNRPDIGRAADNGPARVTQIKVDGMALKIKCSSSLNDKLNFYTMSDEIKMILITKEWPQTYTRLNTLVADDDQFVGPATRRFGTASDKDSAHGLTGVPVTVIACFVLATTLFNTIIIDLT